MKQYCRYCAFCSYGDAVYCAAKDSTMSEEMAKRVNKCKNFYLCSRDVFDHTKFYKPRESTMKNETISLFEEA